MMLTKQFLKNSVTFLLVQSLSRLLEPTLAVFPTHQIFEIYFDNSTTEEESYSKLTVTENVEDLTTLWDPIASNLTTSWCSRSQGMWIFYSQANYSSQSSYCGYIKTGYKDELPSNNSSYQVGECFNLPDGEQIRSIRHMAYGNLSRSGLSLYLHDPNGAIGNELFIDGNYLSLPIPSYYRFGAYGFTGFNNWSVYTLPSFGGNSTCLTLPLDYLTSNKSNDGVGVMSSRLNVELLVGSIRRGCTGTEDITLNPMEANSTELNISKRGSRRLLSEYPIIEGENTSSLPKEDSIVFPNDWDPSKQIASFTVTTIEGDFTFSGNFLKLPFPIHATSLYISSSQVRQNGSSENANVPVAWYFCSMEGNCRCFKQDSSKNNNSTSEDVLQFEEPIEIFSARLFGCGVKSTVRSSSTTLIQKPEGFILLVFFLFLNCVVQ